MGWVSWVNRLSQRAGQVAMALVPLLVLIGAWNVLGRYVGRAVGRNLSSNAFWNCSGICLAPFFSWGRPTPCSTTVTCEWMLVNRWSERRRAWMDLWGTLLFLLPFVVLLIWVTVPPVVASWQVGEQSPDPGGLPRYWVKTLPLVGFGLLLLQGIAQVVQLGQFLRRRPD